MMADPVFNYFAPSPPPLVDEQAEQSLLGTLIVRPDKISALPAGFAAEHYGCQNHPEIHHAIVSLSQSGGVTSASVVNALRGLNIEPGYIAALISTMIAPSMAETQANTITDLWRRREMTRIAYNLSRQASNVGHHLSPATAITEAMGELDAVAAAAINRETMFDIGQAGQLAIEAGERAASGITQGLLTGFRDIDAAIGALEPGGLYIVAGRPGMGKTAIAVQMAYRMALAGHRILYDSLEMQAAQIGRRTLSFVSGISLHVLKSGRWNQSDAELLVSARRGLQNVPLLIDQQAGISTGMIALKSRTAKRKLGGLDAIFVDHMHIVQTDAQAEKNGATRAVEKVSGDLKRLAVDMGVPVIALAQLNRGVESRDDKRPSMADLRQSGAIEQDAEAILMMYRPEYYLAKAEPLQGVGQSEGAHDKAVIQWRDDRDRLAGKAECIIAKLRDGEPGTIPLKFDGTRTAFEDA